MPKMMKPNTMIEPTSGWARINSTGTAATREGVDDVLRCRLDVLPSRFSDSSMRHAEDDRDLRELRRLELEAAAEGDPGVRAVDPLAER